MSNEVSLQVSTVGLAALAEMALATKDQSKIDQLLARNAEGKLTQEESHELDLLLKKIDELNLIKARATAALHQLTEEE